MRLIIAFGVLGIAMIAADAIVYHGQYKKAAWTKLDQQAAIVRYRIDWWISRQGRRSS